MKSFIGKSQKFILVRFFGYYRKNQVLVRFSTFRTFRLYLTLLAILVTRVTNTRNTGNSNPKILAVRTPEGPRRPYDRSPKVRPWLEGLITVAQRTTIIIARRITYALPRALPRALSPRENRPNRPNLGSNFRQCQQFIPYSLSECFSRS